MKYNVVKEVKKTIRENLKGLRKSLKIAEKTDDYIEALKGML